MELIQGFEIVEKIGEGGFSSVYKVAKSNQRNLVFAAKKFKDYLDHSVFEHEVQCLKKVRGISGTQQFVEAIGYQDSLVIITEFVDGPSLKSTVKHSGPLSDKKAVDYVNQICIVLSELNSRGIHHLDIKPSNIIVEVDRCTLMDFGVARLTNNGRDESVKTDFNYAPPEKYYGKYSSHSDVYSLGITLYYLVTGVLPFGFQGNNDAHKMLCHCSEPPQFPKSLNPKVSQLLQQMLAKEEKDRIDLFELNQCLEILSNENLSNSPNQKQHQPKKKIPDEIDCYHRAAKLGIPYAQYKYALLLEDDHPEQAIQWYRRSSKQKFARAGNNLANMLDKMGQKQEALLLYTEAAKTGNAHAQYNLARNLEKSDSLSALKLYKKAADGGHHRAQNQVALTLEQSGNPKQAMSYYRRAAYGGNRAAQYNLGLIYEAAFANAPEPQLALNNAIYWYQKAAEQDHLKAQKRLDKLEASTANVS